MVLVRPWRDARGGTGCCAGDARHGVVLERAAGAPGACAEADAVAAVYLRIRAERPDIDVQVVDAGNTAWLLPAAYRAARRRLGRVASVRAALRAPAAGAVLVDGLRVGEVDRLGGPGVMSRLPAVDSGTSGISTRC